MTFPVIIHESEYGFDAHCPTLPGCVSQGDSFDDALANIKSAIKEYLEAMEIVEKGKAEHTQMVMVEVAA
jgi:predicted RNase H-like HicB family nuclease